MIGQTLRNLQRTRQIVGILIKYGFEDVVASTPALRKLLAGTPNSVGKAAGEYRSFVEYSRWERVRMVFEELGPTFVKLGQVLSNRPDILPEELIIELQKLQSNVQPFAFDKVKEIIEVDTGQRLDEVFQSFEEKPLGSASIGQVHKAVLHDGTEVVVKVRRPKVKQIVAIDISVMRDFVQRSKSMLEKNGVINAMDVVDAFDRSMQKEMDYLNEARNIESFRNAYKDYTNFYVPKVYRELSTSRMLVMEMVKGCKITDVQQLREWGIDPGYIAEQGITIYLTQIFEYGFFHADPHPGNIIIQPDGRICLIDFGMIGTLMRRDRYALAGVFVAMSQQNPQSMASNLRKLSIEDNITNMRALEYDLNDIIEDFSTLSVQEANIAEMTTRLQKVVYDHRLRVPGGVFIILRALAILEGIGKEIHPNFQTYEFIRPFGAKLVRDQLDPNNLTMEALNRASDLFAFLESFPVEVRDIMVQMRKGKLQYRYEIANYRAIFKRADQLVNRVFLALFVVALLLASAIMTTADLPPVKWGLPMPSLIGFSLALLFALLLLRNKAK